MTDKSAVPSSATTVDYCPEKLKPGGCQLHNLHCGYPECNEPPTTGAPAQLPQQATPAAGDVTAARASTIGPYSVGEPEDEDDSATVLNASGEALTADEIVAALNRSASSSTAPKCSTCGAPGYGRCEAPGCGAPSSAMATTSDDSRDGRRYRWLQQQPCRQDGTPASESCYLDLNPRDMDAAIDAAMSATRDGGADAK